MTYDLMAFWGMSHLLKPPLLRWYIWLSTCKIISLLEIFLWKSLDLCRRWQRGKRFYLHHIGCVASIKINLHIITYSILDTINYKRYLQHQRMLQKVILAVCKKQHHTCCQQRRPSKSMTVHQEVQIESNKTSVGNQKVGQNRCSDRTIPWIIYKNKNIYTS